MIIHLIVFRRVVYPSSTFREITFIILGIWVLISIILWIRKKYIQGENNKKHDKKVEELLQNGKSIIIDLSEALVKIIEIENENYYTDPYDPAEDRIEKKYHSIIILKFIVEKKTYIHEITVPLRALIIQHQFKEQQKTILIYDSYDPNHCVVDIGFLD
ncbi:hypothetical protein C8J95_101477 [Elizabethkingia sp. YR214]|uniref:hypothetical protein n=1 Tax=Elizabethkingia sp. YR214 TaxID=2135667 RepID=UPI000D31C31F|nr:hypothetical protein [Elizabethkingia sp. YR214]PUB35796.1 hypothetical protein C8J95_101477 [Elizabethkingia sp. YR214]